MTTEREIEEARATYLKALQAKRRDLQKELNDIDRQLAILTGSNIVENKEKKSRTSPIDNISNDELFPKIKQIMNIHGGPTHYTYIAEKLSENGVILKGKKPETVLYARMNKAASDKQGMFIRHDRGMFSLNQLYKENKA